MGFQNQAGEFHCIDVSRAQGKKGSEIASEMVMEVKKWSAEDKVTFVMSDQV